ncbi:MAG TPA: class I SAM-dependent methyltransferase [Planctomycetota bacterium]|nr:class I SAM-dependent methyltransferase [Planctomycetota bacterium]
MTPSAPTYDVLGAGYREHRRPDERIARALREALGGARRVANVGAGAGSYEPADGDVIAVEPSRRMLGQRPPGSAPAVCGQAEDLPFADGSFDAAMAVLTMHHWRDWQRGLREMQRVARTVAILTWDPAHEGFWLVQRYFPDLLDHDRRIFPPLASLAAMLPQASVTCVPIPHDCSDGFLGAYWRRPQAYLDPGVRRAISSFAQVADVDARIDRLRRDLADGSWRRENARLGDLEALDLGYRLVVARPARR